MVLAEIEELRQARTPRTPGSPAARRAAHTGECRGQSRATSARRGSGCSPRPAHRNPPGARPSSPSGCGATASRPWTGRWCRWCRTATPASTDRWCAAAPAGGGREPLGIGGRRRRFRSALRSPSQLCGDLRRREHLRDPGVVEDLLHLAGVQLVVDRDDDALGGPDGEHQLDDLRAVLAGDRDPRPRGTERGRQSQRPLAQLAPRMQLALTEIHRAAVAVAVRGLVEQGEQVQRRNPLPSSARSPTGTSSSSSRRRRRSSAR